MTLYLINQQIYYSNEKLSSAQCMEEEGKPTYGITNVMMTSDFLSLAPDGELLESGVPLTLEIVPPINQTPLPTEPVEKQRKSLKKGQNYINLMIKKELKEKPDMKEIVKVQQ